MITNERIEEIAAEQARNVCEAGAPAAATHNQRTVAHAIRQALEEERESNARDKQPGGEQ